MRLNFYGAARAVTGSCMMLEVNSYKVLIDCGMPQGSEAENTGMNFPFKAREVDSVLVTHAHVDHVGRLPLLVKYGFNGIIWTTDQTKKLAEIILLDCAKLQELDADHKNSKLIRQGKTPNVKPLYTTEDAMRTIDMIDSKPYGEEFEPVHGLKVLFSDAGHMLGSASIVAKAENRTVVFSGDIGNPYNDLIAESKPIKTADYVIMESTYGNRLHDYTGDNSTEAKVEELRDIVHEAFAKGGKVIIPCFAVGRTQEILYYLYLINKTEEVPVFLDSPMAIKATQVFLEVNAEYYKEEFSHLLEQGVDPMAFPALKYLLTPSDSASMNEYEGSCVIVSSSGMCEGGRIVHHLRHQLPRKENTVLFTGYQANGTLGRRILEGNKTVNVSGHTVEVKASVRSLKGMSGHADKNGLVEWVSRIEPKPRQVFVVHGGSHIAPDFAGLLREKGFNALAPEFKESYSL